MFGMLNLPHSVLLTTLRNPSVPSYTSQTPSSGLLSYKTALNTTMYLKAEKSHVAWQAAFRNMQFICDMFRYTASYGALKVFQTLRREILVVMPPCIIL